MDPILKQLKDALANSAAEMQALIDTADSESRNLTSDEEKRFSELDAECKASKDKIKAREKVLDAKSRIAGYAADADRPQATISRPGPIITRQHNNAEDDPKAGFKTPRDFLLAVMDAGRTNEARVDDRLLPLRAAAGSDEHSTFSDSYGGYLIPEGMLPGLMMLDPEADPTSGLTTRIPMTAPSVKINARTDKNHQTSVSGGLRVYRREEAGTVAASRMQVEKLQLNAHTLMGVAYETEELITDSPVSFAALIQAGFSDELSAVIIKEKLFGTGVGEMEGVMNSPCLVSVAKDTGQPAASISYNNLANMIARQWRYGRSVWIYNHDCLPQLMSLADDYGRLLWQPSAREGMPNSLFGRPAYPSEFCKTLGTTGDIILGDWSQYLEGVYQGRQAAESMHVRFLNHERTFKVWMRNDGRTWWRSALTPNQSSSTLSPFVALDTRS